MCFAAKGRLQGRAAKLLRARRRNPGIRTVHWVHGNFLTANGSLSNNSFRFPDQTYFKPIQAAVSFQLAICILPETAFQNLL